MSYEEILQLLKGILHHKTQFLTPPEQEALQEAIAYIEHEITRVKRGRQ